VLEVPARFPGNQVPRARLQFDLVSRAAGRQATLILRRYIHSAPCHRAAHLDAREFEPSNVGDKLLLLSPGDELRPVEETDRERRCEQRVLMPPRHEIY